MIGARLGFALVLALVLASFAAEAAEPDPALKAFLTKFAIMAERGAVDAMVKVTRFPLKNRVYQEPDRINATGFERHFKLNRFDELASCLKATPPRRAEGRDSDLGAWEVDCDGNIFYFAQEGGGWRFTGFENANE